MSIPESEKHSTFPDGPYRCIVADPPWPLAITGRFDKQRICPKRPRGIDQRARCLPYEPMTVADIAALPVGDMAKPATHLWLWTTNQHLHDAFHVLEAWGFRYLTTVTWTKPSGIGAWFASTTQHCLFAYRERCEFPLARWRPTHFEATPYRWQHSGKPDAFYDLVRSISPGPRIDLFNRRHIEGFEGWGDEAPAEYQPRLLGATA